MRSGIILLAAAALSGCAAEVFTGGAEPMAPAPEGAAAGLQQGWSSALQTQFYHTAQGSPVAPYPWALALETLDGSGRFFGPENTARYGFLAADGPSALNPDQLPIGFTIETQDGAPFPSVGLTCAACHTAEITAPSGAKFRLDGGPAQIDIDRFLTDMAKALIATADDPARFDRFAGTILPQDTPEGRAQLMAGLARVKAEAAAQAQQRQSTVIAGPGRVDALTKIVNAVAARDQRDPRNFVVPDAPVSYPPLWLTNDLEFVQWMPVASSPIERNAAQVLGVFGSIDLGDDPARWFRSTARVDALLDMERWVSALKPPQWDEAAFGPIDADLAAAGADLFKEHCAACHNMAPYAMTDPAENAFGAEFIKIGKVNYRAVGTDPVYAETLLNRVIQTNAATASLHDGAAVVDGPSYFTTIARAASDTAMDAAGLDVEAQLAAHGLRFRPSDTPGGPLQPYRLENPAVLKASPLAGVWATGPYLHNGSVPTLYELLSPEEERRMVFWTGDDRLDVKRLGYLSEEAPGLFRFDASLPGNRNIGHLFPKAGLTPEERWAIIEYLKTQ